MLEAGCKILQFPCRRPEDMGHAAVPTRRKNTEYRSREYLTEDEVEKLIDAAGRVGRHRHRDATMIMLAFRHGLRVAELTRLRWDQIDLKEGLIHVNRVKRGTPSVHPLRGPELIALAGIPQSQATSSHVFNSERGEPLTADTFRKIVGRAGRLAELPFPVHPHMLRHACGYKFAQAGQDTRAIQHYLGHRNIQHTVRYTQLSADRFRNFWND
jgi:type 1 fimbriae regulatory protein FimE